jgi:predicted GH43/DUF377 family glycosyl hydrolase
VSRTIPSGPRRSSNGITPDHRRVLARPFIPGEWGSISERSRVDAVIDRIMAIPDDQVPALVSQVRGRFGDRHRDLDSVLLRHAALVHDRVSGRALSADRRLLLGAYFTQEYAVEAAALTNPSIVAAPDQRGTAPGERRFVLSVRAIGEGHISSIGFRTGTIAANGDVDIDEPGRFVVAGTAADTFYDRELFKRKLIESGANEEVTAFVFDRLPANFTADELESWLHALDDYQFGAAEVHETVRLSHWLASSNYSTSFPQDTRISERVLFPVGPAESRGMEDARFVRFIDDDHSARYYATYTAFDGFTIRPQLIDTPDFRTFRIATLNGVGVQTKGMALFPCKIAGRYMALTRPDRESIALSTADHVREWDSAMTVLWRPGTVPWDLIQIGNNGSPVETGAGWLVLTHGVGPLRRYVLGALLLDLDDPTRVIGYLPEALLEPTDEERDGYVPNVVYSCGALVHGDRLVVPYGYSDVGAGIVTFPLDDLLDRLVAAGAGAP